MPLSVFTKVCLALTLFFLVACESMPSLPGSGGNKESTVKIPGGVKSPLGDEATLTPADQAIMLRAVAAMDAGNYAVAITEFKALSVSNPKLAMPYINLAIAYRTQADSDAAVRSIAQALKLSPNSPEANNIRGVLWRDAGEFTKARDSYAKAIGANEAYLDAQLNLGILCDLYLQDLACAKKHYENYQSGSSTEDRTVKGWLIELERRMKK